MARVFICTDTALNGLLDPAAAALQAEGHTIVRGGSNEVGKTKTYTAAECDALLAQADVAVFTPRHLCSGALMAAAPRLRGVCYPVTGVDSLDLPAAAELGIIVGHGAVPGNVIGMAEATVMLILMLFYDIDTNMRLIGAGKWRRPGHNSLQVQGKTIGLIGFGRIAREVTARLTPFGVTILTTSPRTPQADMPDGVRKVELPELLAQSDLVSVLTGLSPETRHLLGAAELALMKPSAYLVNTGRGAVIDEEALYEALRDRRIAGAALDVFTVEPLPADSKLRALDNALLIPHCAGHTKESWNELGVAVVDNVRSILADRLPPFCKNPEVEPAWRARLQRLQAA